MLSPLGNVNMGNTIDQDDATTSIKVHHLNVNDMYM